MLYNGEKGDVAVVCNDIITLVIMTIVITIPIVNMKVQAGLGFEQIIAISLCITLAIISISTSYVLHN